jgi:transcriptional regulator with XRE-family HTH domain
MAAMVFIQEESRVLAALGLRLRERRLESGQSQQTFAERIGVSLPTLRAMERGVPTVQVAFWIRALWALGRLDDLSAVLAPAGSLFDQLERRRSVGGRQRAPRRRRT